MTSETRLSATDAWPVHNNPTAVLTDPLEFWNSNAGCCSRDGLRQVCYSFTPVIDFVVRYCVAGSLVDGPFLALYRAGVPSVFPPEPMQAYWTPPVSSAIRQVHWMTPLGPRPTSDAVMALIRAAAGPRQVVYRRPVDDDDSKTAGADSKTDDRAGWMAAAEVRAKSSAGNNDNVGNHTWSYADLLRWIGLMTDFVPPSTAADVIAADQKRFEAADPPEPNQLRVRVSRNELRQRTRLKEAAGSHPTGRPLLLIERNDGEVVVLSDS
jgi:hypothetical protein